MNEPSLLRYSWTGDQGGDVTQVVYRLEPHAGGTGFSYDHTGFTGVGGVFMATLLGHVRSKMLNVGLPPVLDDLDEGRALRPGSLSGPSPWGDASRPLPSRLPASPQFSTQARQRLQAGRGVVSGRTCRWRPG